MDETFAIATLWACSILVITGGLLHARACIMEAKTHEVLENILDIIMRFNTEKELKHEGTDGD